MYPIIISTANSYNIPYLLLESRIQHTHIRWCRYFLDKNRSCLLSSLQDSVMRLTFEYKKLYDDV